MRFRAKAEQTAGRASGIEGGMGMVLGPKPNEPLGEPAGFHGVRVERVFKAKAEPTTGRASGIEGGMGEEWC